MVPSYIEVGVGGLPNIHHFTISPLFLLPYPPSLNAFVSQAARCTPLVTILRFQDGMTPQVAPPKMGLIPL